MGAAFDLIRLGRQDVVLCGGGEELHETSVGSFDILFAASSHYDDRPSLTPRPFDSDRDGLVCGEADAVLLSLKVSITPNAGGARVLAEVLGYHTCNNGTHVTQSDDASMTRCMAAALGDSGLAAGDLGYVSAHATGTLQGDAAEAAAIAATLGSDVPVSSLKGHMGHTLARFGSHRTGGHGGNDEPRRYLPDAAFGPYRSGVLGHSPGSPEDAA